MSKNGANKGERAISRVLLLVILAAPLFAYSEPQYVFKSKDLSIILYDDLCEMKDQVTNLPRKAVWRHKDEVVEGCWGFSEPFSLILLYFADKTSTAIPSPLFGKLTGV